MAGGSLAVTILLSTAVIMPGLGDSEPVGSALSRQVAVVLDTVVFLPAGFFHGILRLSFMFTQSEPFGT